MRIHVQFDVDALACTHSAEIVCTRSVEALDGASNFAAHRVTGVQASNWERGLESTVNQSSVVRLLVEDCVNG